MINAKYVKAYEIITQAFYSLNPDEREAAINYLIYYECLACLEAGIFDQFVEFIDDSINAACTDYENETEEEVISCH